jgi:hypothetical protein
MSRLLKLKNDIPNRFDFQRRVFETSLQYVEEFGQFTGDPQHNAAKESIRNRLQQRPVSEEHEPWSDAQDEEWRRQIEHDTVMLLNLCPGTVEEAQGMIPSLRRLTADEVKEMLDELHGFRQ